MRSSARRSATAITAALVLAMAPLAGVAQDTEAPVETVETPDTRVSLRLHSFLSDDEVMLLRQIAASAEARQTLLGESGGHSAIAAAPEEGFFVDGMPAPSAAALSQLPDAETARRDALATCDAARSTSAACVIILEAAPAG